MKYYFGDRSCESCKETKAILDRYGIIVSFIDVQGDPMYENRTPILVLEDGTELHGKDAILQWLGGVQ